MQAQENGEKGRGEGEGPEKYHCFSSVYSYLHSYIVVQMSRAHALHVEQDLLHHVRGHPRRVQEVHVLLVDRKERICKPEHK